MCIYFNLPGNQGSRPGNLRCYWQSASSLFHFHHSFHPTQFRHYAPFYHSRKVNLNLRHWSRSMFASLQKIMNKSFFHSLKHRGSHFLIYKVKPIFRFFSFWKWSLMCCATALERKFVRGPSMMATWNKPYIQVRRSMTYLITIMQTQTTSRSIQCPSSLWSKVALLMVVVMMMVMKLMVGNSSLSRCSGRESVGLSCFSWTSRIYS